MGVNKEIKFYSDVNDYQRKISARAAILTLAALLQGGPFYSKLAIR